MHASWCFLGFLYGLFIYLAGRAVGEDVCDWKAKKVVWQSKQFLIILHG